MKKVINLYGGPGTGKSTTAAYIFYLLKQNGTNAELVTEYIKNWVWEERQILKGDQYYIFTKQSRLERIKFKNVDVIVTDCPVWLSVIYERKFEPKPHVCDILINKHVEIAKSMGVEHLHVFLNRVKPYNTVGRYQTEDEARKIDSELKSYMDEINLKYLELPADSNAAQSIIEHFGL